MHHMGEQCIGGAQVALPSGHGHVFAICCGGAPVVASTDLALLAQSMLLAALRGGTALP